MSQENKMRWATGHNNDNNKKTRYFQVMLSWLCTFFFRGLEVRESIPLGKRPNNNENS